MTLDDFRRLIARISLAAPLRPALVPVKAAAPAPRRPLAPRPSGRRPA